tara:strand:- start:104 stop:493 length:390 start_codon:yes stop_codon:yes gene_type:complete
MNAKDLELKISGLEKAIKEHDDASATFQNDLKLTQKQLDDYNKPEITPMMMDEIHSAVEKAVEGFDFSNTDNYEFEYGMEYDGKVYCESVGLQCAYELTEQIVNNVCKLFKEADCPEEELEANSSFGND